MDKELLKRLRSLVNEHLVAHKHVHIECENIFKELLSKTDDTSKTES